MSSPSHEDLMRQNLIVIAQTYANAKGWSLTTVSKQIHGNQKFLAEYFAGQMSPTVRTYFLMIERLRANWPRGTAWPKTAPLPKLGKKVDTRRAAA
jgi:hypothetical protein